ncbi:DEAD/DEAH box helicase, partial [Paraburkholderia sp. BR14262]|uniref:primosomal protein N' family DNA-binding protein n=1 Tax=Paraburkholderia sp. BR14262 TaxID=3236999 RepID=UPI0034CEA09E
RYGLDSAPEPGMLVRVPFGRRDVVGLICEVTTHSDVPANKLRDVSAVCAACPPLSAQWLALAGFAADYYQRGLGEVALPALPQALRDSSRWARLLAPEERYRLSPQGRAELPDALPARAQALRRLAQALVDAGELDAAAARALHPKAIATLEAWCEAGWVEHESIAVGAAASAAHSAPQTAAMVDVPRLSDEQAEAVEAIGAASGFAPFLLHGVTGSGKTEVYLRALAALLERDLGAQALVLVPEINLTLHSGLAEGERARNWLAAHTGRARIVLGTRLAVLASLPRLSMLVIDEVHAPAYKQQEGLRYSARDLAVWRAKQLGVPVVLGSATPSLESWWQAEQGRYTRLTLSRRAIADAVLPTVKLIDLEEERRRGRASFEGLSGPLVAAMKARLERGEQSLVFLNRRGYAPTLACDACGWVAGCPRCSA